MKNIFIFIFLLLFAFSCRSKQSYTISGVLYMDCSKSTVVKNAVIEINATKSGMGGTETIGTGTTDNNGYFNITFETRSIAPEMFLTSPVNGGFGNVELGILRFGSHTNLELFANPEKKASIRVLTQRTLTQNDTLYYYYSYYDGLRKVIAPQNNQIIRVLTGTHNDTSAGFIWALGYQQYLQARQTTNPAQIVNFQFPKCNENDLILDIVIP